MTKTNKTPDHPSDPNCGASAARDLIVHVGQRVRTARESKGLPRRVLSDMSGVSPRYLAQLEAGEGNISIGLLLRVARALDQQIEDLISDDDPRPSEAAAVAKLYHLAGPEARQAVLRILAPKDAVSNRAHRLCLIGLRGAGKSTLGELIGRALDLPFVELNQEIESQSGMAVDEVIALYGQEGYRKLEAEAIDRVIESHDSVVLAVAGGIVAEPDTYETLLGAFHTVWVKTTPDEHMARVRAQGDERPMAGNPEAMEHLKSILTSREALYGKALIHLDTSGVSVEVSKQQLLDMIRSNNLLS